MIRGCQQIGITDDFWGHYEQIRKSKLWLDKIKKIYLRSPFSKSSNFHPNRPVVSRTMPTNTDDNNKTFHIHLERGLDS